MKKITLAFSLLIATLGIAQNGGDTCAMAVVVTPGDFTGTLITQDTGSAEQGTLLPQDAAWFSYTPDADGLIDISACNTNTDTRLWVGTGDCGSLTTVVSDDDSCGPSFQSLIEEFSVTAGTTYYIEWDDRWSGAAFDWTLTFTAPPPCPVSETLDVSDVTITSATLTWSEVVNATLGYEWVVMADGEDPADEMNTPVAMGMTNAGELTVMVTGLLENTAYDAYVRSNCDSDGFSEYSDVSEFSTPCSIQTPDYLETFDGGVLPPDCWSEASNGSPSEGPMDIGFGSWGIDDYLNDTTASGDMDNSARINLFFNLERDWLISPQFDLSGGDYELVYNVGVVAFGSQNPSEMGSDDQVLTLISTDEGATWTTLMTYNVDNTPSSAGQEEIIDLAAFDGNAIFAFWGSDGDVNDLEDYDFFIDQFQVRTPLACTAPEITYNEVPDCDNDQYTVEVQVDTLGSAVALTVSDDQGSDAQMVAMDGETVTFGPYPSGTAVVFTVTGDDDDCTVMQNVQYTCPPPNDLCADAIALITGEDFAAEAVTTNNIAATDSGAIDPTCGNYDGGDLWFTAVVPADGKLTVETNGSEGSSIVDTGMEVYMGTCDALVLIECDDDDSEDGFFSLVNIDDITLAGQTVYIRAWEWSNDAFGDFQISVYNENINAECTAPVLTVGVIDNCIDGIFTISVSVTELGSAPELTVTDDQGSDPQTIIEDGGVVEFGPFDSGDTIVITVTGDDEDCTIVETVSFTCPPANDFCTEAIALTTGVDFPAEAITATNVGATDSGAGEPMCSTYNGGDVWFTAVVPPSGLLNIETNSSDGSPLTDTGMEVYTGECGALVFVACNDDGSEDGLFSLITLEDPVLGGQTVYIRVFEFGNNAFGDFQISVYNENILGVDGFNGEAAVSLYPNPAQNELNITNLSATATVSVTNILGQRVMETTTHKMDVSALKSGMYFVTIQDGPASQTLRFIKK